MLEYAISLKQPWATLLVHGIKCIEIRSWPTERTCRILIHAAKIDDRRKEAWRLVPKELLHATRLVGGIVGAGELTGCIAYRDREAFAADQALHRNEPSWFAPPVLYGFTFEALTVLPFRHYPGWVRFFRVESEKPERRPRKPK